MSAHDTRNAVDDRGRPEYTITAQAFNEVAVEQMLPRAHQMGIRLVELRRGYAEAEVPMEGNGNHLGTMYAAVLFAVAEILGGAIVASSFDVGKVYPVVKDLKISFRKPARDTVTARASMTEKQIAELATEADADGKAQFTFCTELFDTDGELVAETEGTYQIRSHGR